MDTSICKQEKEEKITWILQPTSKKRKNKLYRFLNLSARKGIKISYGYFKEREENILWILQSVSKKRKRIFYGYLNLSERKGRKNCMDTSAYKQEKEAKIVYIDTSSNKKNCKQETETNRQTDRQGD